MGTQMMLSTRWDNIPDGYAAYNIQEVGEHCKWVRRLHHPRGGGIYSIRVGRLQYSRGGGIFQKGTQTNILTRRGNIANGYAAYTIFKAGEKWTTIVYAYHTIRQAEKLCKKVRRLHYS